jgi:hypothetical protein
MAAALGEAVDDPVEDSFKSLAAPAQTVISTQNASFVGCRCKIGQDRSEGDAMAGEQADEAIDSVETSRELRPDRGPESGDLTIAPTIPEEGPTAPAPAAPRPTSLLGNIFRGIGIAYIALIGILAIEELQRRESILTSIVKREGDVQTALSLLGDSQEKRVTDKRAALEGERDKLRALRAHTNALVLVGPLRPDNRTPIALKQISCELAKLDDPALACPAAPRAEGMTFAERVRDGGRELAAVFFLKRTAERTSSGDVFAILVVVAAIGGALIRLYLPGRVRTDPYHTVLRAIGGGTVCYLILKGGSIPFMGTDVRMYTNPATAALLGLVAGMFSTRVFKVISDAVDAAASKLSTQPPSVPAGKAGPTGKDAGNAEPPRPTEKEKVA